MRRLKLVVEYDGTGYNGFAIQSRLPSIQGELEGAIARVTGEAIRIVGAGRTDAGAHAMGQVVSMDTGSRLHPPDMRRALNANLPDDIVVRHVEEVDQAFHARRSALRRHYRYCLWNAPLPSVWCRRYRYHVADPLNVVAMNQAAEAVTGTKDFAAFTFGLGRYMASGRRRTTIRTVFSAQWSGTAPELDFNIVGTAFLPHMIRNIVGSLVRVGMGKRTPDEFRRMFEEGAVDLSTSTVPALGLMLVGVEY